MIIAIILGAIRMPNMLKTAVIGKFKISRV